MTLKNDILIFEIENAQSMADAIASLIDDPDLRRELEDKNYAAAKGLPMNELAQWYLSHIKVVQKEKKILV